MNTEQIEKLIARIRVARSVEKTMNEGHAVGLYYLNATQHDIIHTLRQLEEVYVETTGVWYDDDIIEDGAYQEWAEVHDFGENGEV